jgi:hypothetical protein
MLPPPLAPPLPTRPLRRPRRPIPWRALLGIALLLVGVVGMIAWVGAFSPYGFVRFSFPRGDRTITISRPGDYLVFQEGADATDADLPPRLAITVIDERGRNVPVERLVEPGTRGAPYAYHVPPNEGRAIARFTAQRAGGYLLQVEALDPGDIDPSDYQSELPTSLAVGRSLRVAWLRTPLGLLAMGVVPLAAGIWVLVWARRGRPVVANAKPPGSPLQRVQ